MSAHSLATPRSHVVPRPTLAPRAAWSAALRWLKLAWTAHATRTHLAAMDERLLRDIGVSRAAAEREASRHFWQFEAPPRS